MHLDLNEATIPLVRHCIKSSKFSIIIGSTVEPTVYQRVIKAFVANIPDEARDLVTCHEHFFWMVFVPKTFMPTDSVYSIIKKALGTKLCTNPMDVTTLVRDVVEGVRINAALVKLTDLPAVTEVVWSPMGEKPAAQPSTGAAYTQADLN